MPDIRAVITDLDGTVLDEQKRVSAATVDAATDLAGLQIPLVVATARAPTWFATLEALVPTVRVAVCCGGAAGWAPATRELLWRDTIAPHIVERLVRHIDQHLPEAGIATYDTERWRVTDNFARRGPARRGPVEVVATGRLATGPVCAMAICHPDHDALRTLLADVETSTGSSDETSAESSLTVDTTPTGVVNLGPAGTDKARGVLRALDVLGVDPAHAIAFGDMHIDLPMFGVCGYSVAVANAHSDVIAAATYIAACVHDDGFARTLGRLGLTRAHQASSTPACSCPPVAGVSPARRLS